MLFLLLNNQNDISYGHVRKCVMLSIIFWTIYYKIWLEIKKQIVGIPMGTNCAPHVADFFCYDRDFMYERDFMLSLSDNNQTDIIEAFTSTSR